LHQKKKSVNPKEPYAHKGKGGRPYTRENSIPRGVLLVVVFGAIFTHPHAKLNVVGHIR
jgi:hypothetical protein